MKYIIESLRAVRRRTLPALNLDTGERTMGMSWAKSIYYLFYWWGKRLTRWLYDRN